MPELKVSAQSLNALIPASHSGETPIKGALYKADVFCFGVTQGDFLVSPFFAKNFILYLTKHENEDGKQSVLLLFLY